MTAVVASFASVTLVSLVTLVGLASLSMDEQRIRRAATFFVSFAVGALLGDAFIHLIPEIFGGGPRASPLVRSLLVLGGIMLFFVVEKLLRHRHGVPRQPGGRGKASVRLRALCRRSHACRDYRRPPLNRQVVRWRRSQRRVNGKRG
jgi:zinc transporter ZupT